MDNDTAHDAPGFPPRGEVHLTIYALPTDRFDRPPVIRLRAALKVLLRQFGLKCTGIRPALPPEGVE